MPRNVMDLRFCVRRPDGYVSSVWKIWATQSGDVYLAIRSMTSIEKYSFHASGICRSAFTREHGVPASMTDRAMCKWKRSPTPPIANHGASRVAVIAFPTDFLSRPTVEIQKEILWIEAAPEGGATYLELAYTNESEATLLHAFGEAHDRHLLKYAKFTTGGAFFINYYHADWENNDLSVPGEGKVNDLLFSANDPGNTGRPLRIRIGSNPKDGDAIHLQELGGFAILRT